MMSPSLSQIFMNSEILDFSVIAMCHTPSLFSEIANIENREQLLIHNGEL